MRRALVLATTLGMALACGEAPETRGIRSRISVDRTEARVGDRVGITIEIETPPGFAIETPAPPGSADFFTESMELAEPIELRGGVRHHVLWTVRPKEVGDDRALPTVEVPIARPGGEVQRLVVGQIPLPVRSVRDELPEQETYFDIRAAPAPPDNTALVLGSVASFAGFLALVWIAAARYRRRYEEREGPPPPVLAREAIGEIEAALALAETREVAAGLDAAVKRFAQRRWRCELASATTRELPGEVADEVSACLAACELERFRASPDRNTVLETAARVERYLRDVESIR